MSLKQDSGDGPKRGTGLIRDDSGAVMVEFMIVFPPLMAFFLGVLQLMYLEAISLIVNHSAQVAVRAAVTAVPDDPGKRVESPINAVRRAARTPLATLGVTQGAVGVAMTGGGGRDADITVTVTVNYPCTVPLGALIACGGDLTHPFAAQATMPNQGVDWRY